jgi:hypothetical protein
LRKIYQVIFAALAITLIAFLLFRSSEEDKILSHLDELRVLAEVNEPEGAIAQVARARQLSKYFTKVTQFDLVNLGYGTYTIASREELTQIIAKARAVLSTLELLLREVKVTIEGERAEVEVQASALGQVKGEHGRFLDVHRIRVMLTRVEGEWLISGGEHLLDERERSGESIKELLF